MKIQEVLITRSESGLDLAFEVESDGRSFTIERSLAVGGEGLRLIDAIDHAVFSESSAEGIVQKIARVCMSWASPLVKKTMAQQLADAIGLLDPVRTISDSELALSAARIGHQVNRAYRAAIGEDAGPTWDDAPQWQRDSVASGAMAILQDPMRTPEQSHDGWLAQKKADGWVYGEVKDAEKKTHPCIMSYDALPPEQRTKDHLFGAAVRAALDAFVELLDNKEIYGDEVDDGGAMETIEKPSVNPAATWPQVFEHWIEAMDAEERAEMRVAWRSLGEKLFVVS